MPQSADGTPSQSALEQVFCDTCILLNFAQQEWERDRTTALLEETNLYIVIGEAVEEEFETVTDRRLDAYLEFLAFLTETDTAIDSYDPESFGNDEHHLYQIVGQLEDLDPPAAAAKFRKYLRKFRARTDYLMESVVDEVVFTAPPLFFADTLHDVIENGDDCQVVAQAADWAHTNDGGALVTLDGEDILDKQGAINEKIDAEYEDGTTLLIFAPEEVLERLNA